MQTQLPQIQVQFTLQLPPALLEEVKAETERMAKEAYVMALLKHGIISSDCGFQYHSFERIRN